MGSEAETQSDLTLKLPLLALSPMQSPEHPGMLTPPLQTVASVPFKWEEEPGKPRPCTALIPLPNPNTYEPKCLELPPRLLFMDNSPKITKTPSPTTVLEGPEVLRTPKVSSFSFRFFRERQGSFDSTSSSRSPERGQLSSVVLGKKGHKGKGLCGSWGQRKESHGGGSFVFPSSTGFDSDESSSVKGKFGKIRRNGSFSSPFQARSHLWAAICQGFKQVIPWKTRKSKK